MKNNPTEELLLNFTDINIQFYGTRNNEKTSLSEFRITEGEGVCIKNDEQNMSKGRTKYPLERGSKSVCEIDPRFTNTFDFQNKLGEKTFFFVNNAMFIDSIPGMNLNDLYKY